jgi:outer membrane protein assembly factor BamB
MSQSKLIHLGIKGSVIALNSATGQEVWARKLTGSDFVNVVLSGSDVLAATHGELFCLDAQTGIPRWHNPLKGYGWGLVSIAGAGILANPMLALAEKRRKDEAAAASGSAVTAAT